MQTMTHVGLWCLPGSITYSKTSKLLYLCDKKIEIIQSFGRTCVFLGSVEEVSEGKRCDGYEGYQER